MGGAVPGGHAARRHRYGQRHEDESQLDASQIGPAAAASAGPRRRKAIGIADAGDDTVAGRAAARFASPSGSSHSSAARGVGSGLGDARQLANHMVSTSRAGSLRVPCTVGWIRSRAIQRFFWPTASGWRRSWWMAQVLIHPTIEATLVGRHLTGGCRWTWGRCLRPLRCALRSAIALVSRATRVGLTASSLVGPSPAAANDVPARSGSGISRSPSNACPAHRDSCRWYPPCPSGFPDNQS